MTATTALTAAQYRTLANEARTLRASIATYSKPMDEALRALVLEHEGQAGLKALEVASAQYLSEQRAALAAITPAMEAYEANACTRCSGTGDYHGPTSHYRAGRPVCFQCKGSGHR
jgi:hypothetical protein